MLDPSEVMPPSTASLFHLLNVESEISDFYLIGGTALALHIGHRISEDLDFITKAPNAAARLEGDRLREPFEQQRLA